MAGHIMYWEIQDFADNLTWEVCFTKSYSLHIPLTLYQKYNENCYRQPQTYWPFYFTKKLKRGDIWQACKFGLWLEQEIQNDRV